MEEKGSAANREFFQENQDSDQSFSEEEDMDVKWMTNDNFFSGSSGNKGGIGILSQLELLTDVKRSRHSTDTMNSHQLGIQEKAVLHFCYSGILQFKEQSDGLKQPKDSLSVPRQRGLCKEDDVEVPFSQSQDGGFINKNDHRMALSCCLDDEFCHTTRMTSTCNSEEEIKSDDEMRPSTDGNLKRDGKCTMPKVSADCKSGVFSTKDSGCSLLYRASSKLNRSSKGSRGKAKPKFLFQSRQQKKDFALAVHDNCETSNMQSKNIESLDDLLENFGGNEIQLFEENLVSSEVAVAHDSNEHSMAEFLDHFQHTSSLPRGNSKMQLLTKRQGSRFLRKNNLLLLGDRNMSNGDQPEALDSDPSSDEDKIPKSVIPLRTMADQFHLALGSVSANERLSIPRPKQFGLYGRLQHVMQCEKDRDTYFLEKSQTHDASSGAERFIDVRILSSSLDAKLTVCFCALHGDEEGSECLSNPQKGRGTGGRKLSIIFSSRICKDVELEIGNVIRIHQPWKEVHVNENDEAIILCAYFSQI